MKKSQKQQRCWNCKFGARLGLKSKTCLRVYCEKKHEEMGTNNVCESYKRYW